MELISQGAESRIFLSTYLSQPCIIKERLSKKYRVKELDNKINKQRLLFEARCLARCRKFGIMTPSLFYVDTVHCQLFMEYIIGKTIKEILRNDFDINNSYSSEMVDLVKAIGIALGKMHEADIAHGDLTTSNILIRYEKDNLSFEVVLIDFGLGQMKPIIEDKAVDLYVLERAFISTHPNSEYLVGELLNSYRFASSKGTTVLQKLEQVRQRGRKREMFG